MMQRTAPPAPPYCFWCGRRNARPLPLPTYCQGPVPVYCSLRCAACSALDLDQRTGLYWCQRCWEWHCEGTPCRHLHPVHHQAHGEGGMQ